MNFNTVFTEFSFPYALLLRMRFGCLSFHGLRRFVPSALFVLALPAFIAAAQPRTNPYSTIASRNVFGLKDPPLPVSLHQPPPPRPVPNLVLTGVADFSTAKWAFITRTDPGRPARNCTLTPGETEDGLQLVDINANKATVILRVDGIDTVTLKLPAVTNRPSGPTPAGRVTRAAPPVFSRLR